MTSRNTERYNEYMAQYMADRYYRRRAEYIEKLGGKCVRCGSEDNLEFDHINADEKSFDVGKALPGMNKAKLDLEMAKCQLLCGDCHLPKSILDRAQKPWAHGTLSGYRYCKCDACKKAKSDHSRSARLIRMMA